VQYYSAEDEVLKQDDVGIPEINITSTLPFIDAEGVEDNAWSVQEKVKGTDLLAGVLQSGVTSGGWGFGTSYQSPGCIPGVEECETNDLLTKTEAFAITSEQLKINPFFRSSIFSGLTSSTSGSEVAARNHPYILAFETPVLSFSVGSTKLNIFTNEQPRPIFDMNVNAVGWPAERDLPENVVQWRHSDFKDVSYLYIHKVFDDIVSEGNMK